MAEFEDDVLRRAFLAFAEGYAGGLAGQPGDLTVMQTPDGPVEGVREGDTITFTFPDGRVLEVHR